jgi:CBS domain-containing protein
MRKKVITVLFSDPFPKIVRLFIVKGISGAPVVDARGKVIGIISEKDLFYKLFPSQKKFYRDLEYYMNYKNIEKDIPALMKFKAKNLMSKRIISISSNEHILKACSMFLVHNIRRLPVIDGGKLVGIVTISSIYRNFLMSLIKK